MGLFKFIKDAGAKIFGGSAQAATPAPQADILTQTVQGHGFDASKLQVHVDGDKVRVTGQAMSTEEAEKIILALGNNQGVAEVQSDLIVQRETAASTMYTVEKGDTLWKIAEEHYGKGQGAKYTEIVKANTPPVKDPDLIQPGWVLRIPSKGATAQA